LFKTHIIKNNRANHPMNIPGATTLASRRACAEQSEVSEATVSRALSISVSIAIIAACSAEQYGSAEACMPMPLSEHGGICFLKM
jgi:hypothetical protein